ncbi:hypothetical protein F511_27315 [Dorcoceras hygrometricum]|uniref:Uncharacterized protein n=1 Tax=Dorcoceras hygrometricum TaxID=472368 RepID=A0A2Z7DAJ5_9LAMI|nr:hypothetical protein F511_27315 [Dorcoceras hygrometricum]
MFRTILDVVFLSFEAKAGLWASSWSVAKIVVACFGSTWLEMPSFEMLRLCFVYCDWLCTVAATGIMRGDVATGVRETGVREMLRPVGKSRVEVNAGQRSCACDWLCWYVAIGTRRVKHCALFCVLSLDDQQLVLRIEHPIRRRLDKLVRRRFEDQSMVCLRWTPLEKLYHPTTFFGSCRGLERKHEVAVLVREFCCAGSVSVQLRDLVPSHNFKLPGCEGERQYRTLISLLGSLATMHRVVNYHSSWARQQQVELVDASAATGIMRGDDATGVRETGVREMLRPVGKSRVEVNAGQRSCACDWLCWSKVMFITILDVLVFLSFEAKAGRWRKTSRSAFCNAADALVNCAVVAGEETSRGTSREFSSVFCVERYTSSFGVLRLLRRCVLMLRLVPDEGSVVALFRFATGYPAAGSATPFRGPVDGNPGSTAGRGFNPAGGEPGGSRTPQNPPQVLNTLSLVPCGESRIQYLCDPQWFRDTASRGPTTIVAPESQFRTCPSDHDSIGYPRMSASGESLTTMHRLLHASGSHPIPPPNDPKTNQYNQDLGLIHSTNGNHLKSPNEGSSIDHQVTINLHAQNITMFPTNETCGLDRGWRVVGPLENPCDLAGGSRAGLPGYSAGLEDVPAGDAPGGV